MHIANLKEKIVFQKTEDGINYTDYYACHAYMNGMTASEYYQTKTGGEFYMDYAGTEGQWVTTVTCRYQKAIARLTPQQYRIKHLVGDEVYYYKLLAPSDDVQLKHQKLKFRARLITNLEEEEEEDGTDNTHETTD